MTTVLLGVVEPRWFVSLLRVHASVLRTNCQVLLLGSVHGRESVRVSVRALAPKVAEGSSERASERGLPLPSARTNSHCTLRNGSVSSCSVNEAPGRVAAGRRVVGACVLKARVGKSRNALEP